MMTWHCWLDEPDEDEEPTFVVETDYGAGDAALASAEMALDSGHWSGDPIPDEVHVWVRSAGGPLTRVDLGVEWAPRFWPRTIEEMT